MGDPRDEANTTTSRRASTPTPISRTVFGVLDSDALAAVFVFVGVNSLFAASLVCKAFNALRPTGMHFHTSVLAMNYTPSMLAWASRLPVPCPPLRCVADLEDTAKILRALRSLGWLAPVALAQHAVAIAQKLDDSDVDVRYETLTTLGKLDSSVLVVYTCDILRKLDDTDADVRYAAVKVLGRLHPAALTPHIGAITALLSDSDIGVQIAVRDVLSTVSASRVWLI